VLESQSTKQIHFLRPAELLKVKKQTRTIKVSEMTESLRRHYKSRSHAKGCLKRWLFKRLQ